MDDLNEILQIKERGMETLLKMKEDFSNRLREMLKEMVESTTQLAAQSSDLPKTQSPMQMQKRPKRLTSLREEDDNSTESSKKSAKIVDKSAVPIDGELSKPVTESVESHTLMAPPSKPVSSVSIVSNVSSLTGAEHSFVRPQRAAKLKSEKNLKEPNLIQKLRRPEDFDRVKIKVEKEERKAMRLNSTDSTKSDNSILYIPENPQAIIEILSDDDTPQLIEKTSEPNINKDREKDNLKAPTFDCRVRLKREKVSLNTQETKIETIENKISLETAAPDEEPTELLQTNKNNNTTATSKRSRKKKNLPKPIKVERLSVIDNNASPIASRTRKNSSEKQKEHQNSIGKKDSNSIYEDAVENLLTQQKEQNVQENVKNTLIPINEIMHNTKKGTETDNNVVTSINNIASTETAISNPSGDATFCTNPTVAQTTFVMDVNATVTLEKDIATCDATFNVIESKKPKQSPVSSNQSMETAKATPDNSLITEDESYCQSTVGIGKKQQKLPLIPKQTSVAKDLPMSGKVYKMPSRTNELFNPLVQSPVKMKVKAFENVATEELTNTLRSKQLTKENIGNGTNITPLIGKLHAPGLGRFLTPTQSSNITPNALAAAKKGPNSASKIMPFPKASSSSLKQTASSSTGKNIPQRENSAEDIKKGLLKLTEERRKQREQKHQLAAQQREAKERERAERLAKLNKEREERRIKKQQEAEQKKRELNEINKNLLQNENSEAVKLKALAKNKAAIANQEREMLTQAKPSKDSTSKKIMQPPPPRVQSKYTFEMLHEDDSTDDESKTSFKRPPPPLWSLSNVRGAAIKTQQYWPTDIIDSFFSVQPMTADLKEIFPNIDARHLKRNSSAFWSTPPRYSELPKY